MENKKREIAKFYEQIFSDAKLKEKLEEKAKTIVNDEDLKNLIQQEIIPLMKKYNVNFSEKELLEYEKETLKKLSEKDLDNVSGGVSIKSALLTGGILSMALLGGVGLNSSIADASKNPPEGPPNNKPGTTQQKSQKRKSASKFKPTTKKVKEQSDNDDDDDTRPSQRSEATESAADKTKKEKKKSKQSDDDNNDNYGQEVSIDEFLACEDDALDSFYVYKVIENNPVEDLKKIDGEKLISFWVKLNDFVIEIPKKTDNRATHPAFHDKDNLEMQNYLKIIAYFQKELVPFLPHEVATLMQDIVNMEKFKEEKVYIPESKLEDYINELKQRERSLDPRVYKFIDSLNINFASDKMRFLFKNKEGQMQETSKESVLKIVEYYRKNLGRRFIKVPDAGFSDNGDPDYFDTNYYGNAIKFLLLEGPLDSVSRIEFFKRYIASPSIFTKRYSQKDLEKFIEILKELRATDKWNKVPTDIKENIDKTINAYGYKENFGGYEEVSGSSDIDVIIAYLNECNRLYEFYRDVEIEGDPNDFHEEILMDFVTGYGSNRSIVNDDFLAKLRLDKKGRFYTRNHTTKKKQIISEEKFLEFLNLYNEFRDYFDPYIPLINIDNGEVFKTALFSTPKAIDEASEEKHTAVSNTINMLIDSGDIEVFPEYIITAAEHFQAADDKYNSEKFNSFQYEACPKGMTDELGTPAQKLINLLKKLFRLKGIFEFSNDGLEAYLEVYRDKVTEMLFNDLNETTRKNIITDCKYFNGYIDKSGKKLKGWFTDYPMDNLNIIKFICEISETAAE